MQGIKDSRELMEDSLVYSVRRRINLVHPTQIRSLKIYLVDVNGYGANLLVWLE